MATIELNQKQCADWAVFMLMVAKAPGRKAMVAMKLEDVPGGVRAELTDHEGATHHTILEEKDG